MSQSPRYPSSLGPRYPNYLGPRYPPKAGPLYRPFHALIIDGVSHTQEWRAELLELLPKLIKATRGSEEDQKGLATAREARLLRLFHTRVDPAKVEQEVRLVFADGLHAKNFCIVGPWCIVPFFAGPKNKGVFDDDMIAFCAALEVHTLEAAFRALTTNPKYNNDLEFRTKAHGKFHAIFSTIQHLYDAVLLKDEAAKMNHAFQPKSNDSKDIQKSESDQKQRHIGSSFDTIIGLLQPQTKAFFIQRLGQGEDHKGPIGEENGEVAEENDDDANDQENAAEGDEQDKPNEMPDDKKQPSDHDIFRPFVVSHPDTLGRLDFILELLMNATRGDETDKKDEEDSRTARMERFGPEYRQMDPLKVQARNRLALWDGLHRKHFEVFDHYLVFRMFDGSRKGKQDKKGAFTDDLISLVLLLLIHSFSHMVKVSDLGENSPSKQSLLLNYQALIHVYQALLCKDASSLCGHAFQPKSDDPKDVRQASREATVSSHMMAKDAIFQSFSQEDQAHIRKIFGSSDLLPEL